MWPFVAVAAAAGWVNWHSDHRTEWHVQLLGWTEVEGFLHLKCHLFGVACEILMRKFHLPILDSASLLGGGLCMLLVILTLTNQMTNSLISLKSYITKSAFYYWELQVGMVEVWGKGRFEWWREWLWGGGRVWFCACVLCALLQAILDGEDDVRKWLDYEHVPTQQVCTYVAILGWCHLSHLRSQGHLGVQENCSLRHCVWQSLDQWHSVAYLHILAMSNNSIGPHEYHMNCLTRPQFATNPKTTVPIFSAQLWSLSCQLIRCAVPMSCGTINVLLSLNYGAFQGKIVVYKFAKIRYWILEYLWYIGL